MKNSKNKIDEMEDFLFIGLSVFVISLFICAIIFVTALILSI